jgi:hypothetical protein
MASFTLSTLRTNIANRINFTVPAASGTFITVAQANADINASIAELYDLLVEKFGNDYYASSTTFSLVNGTAAYNLPADFFKLLGVDYQVASGEYLTLKPFMISERNQYTRSIVRGLVGAEFLRYQIRGSQIVFSPTPTTTNTIQLLYIPLPTTLSADGDTFAGFNGWEEYVIIDCCIKWLAKEESDTASYERQKQNLIARIQSSAGNRDAGFSPRITNVRSLDYESDAEFREF